MRKLVLVAAAAIALGVSAASANAANITAQIDISDQTMTVYKNGFRQYKWKVSTARKGYHTPTGQYTVKWLSKNHRSRKYNNAPMPYSLFFHGGYAVHGTTDLKRLGSPASHGCVRLDPKNAATLFSLAEQNGLKQTKIIIRE
ncbi:L,D-transpeptidase [Rhizobium sp. L1K21]|uniref:L,D-transpeptidase n=1 Tax=Rhizobium sp. L1K21 TaxID=2954933 RepID=UPI002093BEAF|nr:L,D-transpeptidase [Rhizobium sp. L1K21]MCO6185804.1 L,D-transpeptidase [Rhizobium sp. L1K21]